MSGKTRVNSQLLYFTKKHDHLYKTLPNNPGPMNEKSNVQQQQQQHAYRHSRSHFTYTKLTYAVELLLHDPSQHHRQELEQGVGGHQRAPH